MGGEVGDASDGVALDLDVGRQHLSDERVQSSESDDERLVLGWVGTSEVRWSRQP